MTMGAGVDGVRNRGRSVGSGGRDANVADGGADGRGARCRECCRFSNGFLESSGKTSHIVSHSNSMSLISFCKLACKDEVA